jgi:hypothetical protein
MEAVNHLAAAIANFAVELEAYPVHRQSDMLDMLRLPYEQKHRL